MLEIVLNIGGNTMGEKKELIDLLNALLEAERASVETANHLIKHYQLEELDAQYKQLK
jgi:hypothetical protein